MNCSAPFNPFMGSYQFLSGITTSSANAQHFFQQGVDHQFGFNQAESQKSFACCMEADPAAPMCHWGMAYALGPFLNKGQCGEDEWERANFHASAAADLLSQADSFTREEEILVGSFLARFPSGDFEYNQTTASMAYRDFLKGAVEEVDSLDLLSLYGEAEMDVMASAGAAYYHDSLQLTHGAARPEAEAAIAAFQTVLRAADHPLALHLYIHITEPLSPGVDASAGEAAADALRLLNFTGSGHMEHMPGHLFLRVGRYADVVRNNELAARADDEYSGAGHLPYGPAHNTFFLVAAACLDGQYEEAAGFGRKMRDIYRRGDVGDSPGVEEGWNALTYVHVRFGKWQELLDDADDVVPEDVVPEGVEEARSYAAALRHFGRGVALFKTGEAGAAGEELEMLAEVEGEVAEKYADRTRVARLMLGALLADEGDREDMARAAAEETNSWAYNSPPHWALSTNDCLGQVLGAAGAAGGAEDAFDLGLKEYPDQSWSYFGKADAMEMAGQEGAEDVRKMGRDAWERSDQAFVAPCLMFA